MDKKITAKIMTGFKFLFVSGFFLQLFLYPVRTLAFTWGAPSGVPTVDYNNTGPDVSRLIVSVIQLLVVIGSIGVLIMLVWGALDWILSGGDKDKISSARKKITNAIIGLVLLAMAGFVSVLVSDILRVPSIFDGLPIPRLGERV